MNKQKLRQSIFINAPREKVWKTMLEDATYREWTSAFNPGSYYVGSWEKGSAIKFLGPNPDGTTGGEGGMSSIVEESRPYEFVSLKHVGVINNGVVETDTELAKQWTPAYENYTLNEKGGGTELVIELDIVESEKAMMAGMWEKGLAKLKAMAEK